MHRDGVGVAKDLARARSLFVYACDHDDNTACKAKAALPP
jgi:TPR repeat protein